MNRHSWVSGVLCAFALSASAGAQTREPLCATTQTRRLASAPFLLAEGSDFIAARPFAALAPDGAAFVVAARDPDQTLRIGARRELPRALAELEYQGPTAPSGRGAGLAVLRVGRDLRVLGEPVFLADPVPSTRGDETFPPGIPVAVTVGAGVLVLQHVDGDIYATQVPAVGAPTTPARVAQAPAVFRGHRGFVWLTAAPRDDGAVALAGTDTGEVVALRFDANGARVGSPLAWGQRVGGPMQLVALHGRRDPVALLERPVRGTTLEGAQARAQVLVTLSANLEPQGEPVALGLGPYETTAIARGDRLVLAQWAESRGFAVSTLPVTAEGVSVETPRIWTTERFDGVALGHRATLGPAGVIYDLMLQGDDVAGGLHAYATFVPPAGAPFSRRDVMPLRARVIARPALLPAEDGFVAVMGVYDELGGGIDAVHVRCEMVTLPAR
jgi:hypothetical protein